MNLYLKLMRLDKPIGILLLLWPTMWALWIAGLGHPSIKIVLIFMLGVIVMRSAGCIINDFADRHVDRHVLRTVDRPLTSGKVSSTRALILFFILMSIAFVLVLMLNRFSVLLAMVGAVLAVSYPYLKRITHLPQLGLGLAFSWGVPMAFAATNNAVPSNAWLLFFAASVWPVIYDTMYAMVDRDDDIRVGIKSTAIAWGEADKLIIGLLQSVFILLMSACGIFFHLKAPYFYSLICASFFFIYQQKLIHQRNRNQCFQAFLNNHWVGLVIFVGIVVSYRL